MTMNIFIVSFPAGQRIRMTSICDPVPVAPCCSSIRVPASLLNLASPIFQCGLDETFRKICLVATLYSPTNAHVEFIKTN